MKTLIGYDDTGPGFIGRYEILRQIGWSDPSILYEAEDRRLNRRAILKVLDLPPDLSETQSHGRVERFYREAKALSLLVHPGIVTLYDVGVDHDRHFMACEYLWGHSLDEIENMQGALPLKDSLEIALQLTNALSCAHSCGVTHQNVNPDCIHILPGGIIKLTNFGHATVANVSDIAANDGLFGHPAYMSPERLACQTVDHRTDIYSVGVTLYEMLAGRTPFDGDSVLTIAENVMNEQPPEITGVPEIVNSLLQRVLAKDPEERYNGAEELFASLRQVQLTLHGGPYPTT